MKKYRIHTDYERLNIRLPLHAFVLPLMQKMTRALYNRQTVPDTINYHKTTIASHDGYDIPIELFTPVDAGPEHPCLLYIHGGAFALPATDFHKKMAADYALGCSCTVVFVDYRLVPRFPYPYALKDCICAYTWILKNTEELGIDISRIAVCGDSAGGALAAGLTHLVRDRGLPMPLFQMLIYPVLDARLQTDSMKTFTDTPIWNSRLNARMWDLYLPKGTGALKDPYASPNEADTFTGLPPGYIEVSEFDCLRDEAVEYARKLEQAGIPVDLNQAEGTIHGFEVNYASRYTQSIINKRIEYMNRQFTNS
jgi:acetyl esterase/lipase